MRKPGYVLLVLSLFAGCKSGAPAPAATIRLADVYKADFVSGSVAATAELPRSEIRFAAGKPPKASLNVAGLAVRDGRLQGRTQAALSILDLERSEGLEDHDVVDSVEVRARVSAGKEILWTWRESEKVDLAEIAKDDDQWRKRLPLTAGPELKTYVFSTRALSRPPRVSELRHVLLRPTDAKDATFEIESVRLVTRREALAAIKSGVSWQGLSEIYRETLVARSPETVRFKLRLPSKPVLDLGLGTVDDSPLTFRVAVESGTGATKLLERTLTTPHRWEEAPLDLAAYAGQEVTLALSLAADRPGTIGFWGAPAIRNRGAMPQADAPQGVILIWSDTTRRDHLSVYGYERDTTPTLRRMAAEGTLFKDCLSQATWTKVATPTLLTSLYPLSHGVHDFSDRLPSSATTLAEVFHDAGYATLSLSSILFTGRFTNLHQGFDQVHEDGSLPDRESSKTARVYVDRVLPWLAAHRDVPFFVFLHVSDPHDPYRPYPPYDALWADPSKREEHERQAKDVRKVIAAPLLKMFGMPNREELVKAGIDPEAYVAQDVGWYDGSIRAMDVEIGRLLEGLASLGLDKKTLVVYTGDHGEEFLEHGRTFHGQTTYGELNEVPLLLWQPGVVPKGVVVEDAVETVDVMPTILELSRLAPPSGMQGDSLRPLFSPKGAAGTVRADGAWRERPAMTEKAVTTEPVGAPPPQDTESYAIVSAGFKLIHNTKRPAGSPEFELYDHVRDRLDKANVAARHPDVVERLSKQIETWRARAEAARLKPDSAITETMSPEALDRLRALGYVQ
jgi:arylsulfatase A-like enzyme